MWFFSWSKKLIDSAMHISFLHNKVMEIHEKQLDILDVSIVI